MLKSLDIVKLSGLTYPKCCMDIRDIALALALEEESNLSGKAMSGSFKGDCMSKKLQVTEHYTIFLPYHGSSGLLIRCFVDLE